MTTPMTPFRSLSPTTRVATVRYGVLRFFDGDDGDGGGDER